MLINKVISTILFSLILILLAFGSPLALADRGGHGHGGGHGGGHWGGSEHWGSSGHSNTSFSISIGTGGYYNRPAYNGYYYQQHRYYRPSYNQYRYYRPVYYDNYYNNGYWVTTDRWGIPAGAVIFGYRYGQPYYRCQALYRGGYYYGYRYTDVCYIDYNGVSIGIGNFRIYVH